MKKALMSLLLMGGLLGIATRAWAPVEYVKICSLYGAGFYYIPGTDICHNPENGDTRMSTEGGPWMTILPYPEGEWVTNVKSACAPGKRVHVGTFKSTDFTLNDFDRVQTPPVNLTLQPGQFISKVIMSGGFYNPKLPDARHGVNGSDGLCLRSMDPDVYELQGDGTTVNPPYGNGGYPIGCVANSRIVNMPEAYSITSTAAYPNVDEAFISAEDDVSGPYVYGSQLVVTTDLRPGFRFLKYTDHSDNNTVKPSAGALSVDVCVE